MLTSIFQEGYLGVYIFFVISGFVIPYSMHVKDYSTRHFFTFLVKRTLRIEPPYVIFVLLLFCWNFWLNYLKGWGKPIMFDWKTLFLNLTYLAPFFHSKWILVIFWTLAVEFQFYILTGLTYPILCGSKVLRYVLFGIGLFVGWIIPDSYQTVFDNYSYFIIGYLTFLHYTGRINKLEFIISGTIVLIYIYAVGIPITIPLMALTIAALYLLNFKTQISDFFGKTSYSLYLTHAVVGGAISVFTISTLSPWWRFTFAVVCSVAFSGLYYVLIEKRFLAISKKIGYRN